MRSIPHAKPIPRQRGAALLLAALVLVLLSTGWLLGALKGLAKERADQVFESAVALGEAKRALLGWAVGHENVPGMMPWPDRNGDGNYDGNSDCVTSGAPAARFLLGRLPWFAQTAPCAGPRSGLSINVRDAAKEPLWYAVSPSLVRSYNPPANPVVNPALVDDVSAEWLTVRDTTGAVISDRVAVVVFAPGAPLATQNRSASAPAVGEYLDGVTLNGVHYSNADDDEDFIAFTSPGLRPDHQAVFNDQLVFITVEELVSLVEKRVIGEVARALRDYAQAGWNPGGAYPWLSRFEDPSSQAEPGGHVGVGAGFVPVHVPGEAFSTSFEIAWDIPDGAVSLAAPGNLTPLQGFVGPISRLVNVASRCVWLDRATAVCNGRSAPEMVVGVGDELIERIYVVDVALALPRGGEPVVTPPTGSELRRRSLSYGRGASLSVDIQVEDRQVSPPGPTGTSRLLLTDPTRGWLRVAGIRYDLGTGADEELPAWFTKSDWQRFVYASVSPDLQPPGLRTCRRGLTCLSVLNGPGAANDKQALVISMGGRLLSQTRPSGELSDYLEGDNANEDMVFERRRPSEDFNDQIKVVAP